MKHINAVINAVINAIVNAIVNPIIFAAAPLALTACINTQQKPDAEATPAAAPVPPVESAAATLAPAQGQKAKGNLSFTQTAEGVKVIGTFEGLKPKGQHGIHVHESGDCSGPKFASAGGHFNPTKTPHGGPESAEKHIGDFGNLKADVKGRAKFEWTIPNAKLGDPALGLVGRAVIVHLNPDDLKSQPSGNSGDRIACGRIEASNAR